jgi:hypothetical protein
MKIYCSYDETIDTFIKGVTKYTLKKFAASLNLEKLEEIEVQDIREFDYDTDGKIFDNGKKIVLTSRLFELLPSYDIKRLYRNINFKQIVNTLYHEMGHIHDMTVFPSLYGIVFKFENNKEALAALFWTEYLAEKRSSLTDPNCRDFCTQFINTKWKPRINNLNDATVDNYFYLNKVLPYFIARNAVLEDDFIAKISNSLLKSYICELVSELNRLENLLPFDDVEVLNGLYEIMNSYYKQFMKRRQ